MESPHNYENSQHETTVFACPGATSFEVEFDERCETEKRSPVHCNTFPHICLGKLSDSISLSVST